MTTHTSELVSYYVAARTNEKTKFLNPEDRAIAVREGQNGEIIEYYRLKAQYGRLSEISEALGIDGLESANSVVIKVRLRNSRRVLLKVISKEELMTGNEEL